METTIWILKGIIAMIFFYTGFNKILLPKDKLLENGMKGLIDLDDKQITTVGVLEVLGAVGLILPSLLNVYPILSAVSAYCLSLTMVVAASINIKLKLPIFPNIIIFIICILIVIGN